MVALSLGSLIVATGGLVPVYLHLSLRGKEQSTECSLQSTEDSTKTSDFRWVVLAKDNNKDIRDMDENIESIQCVCR